MKQQQRAKLRCCASCEWIYEGLIPCPKCGFASYGARYVYGNKCYKYKITQKPWYDKMLFEYALKLKKEIEQSLDKNSLVFLTHKPFGQR
jgi:hypothetical protein